MTQANELRKQLALYATDKLGVLAFRDWFGPVFRTAHKSGDSTLEMLVHAVEWEFVDFERGLSSESVLKKNLSQLASGDTALAVANPPESSNSRVQVLRQEFVFPAPPVYVLAQTAGSTNGVASCVVLESKNVLSSVVLSDVSVLTPA